MNPSWIKIFAIFAWVGIGIFNVEPALSSNFNIEKKTVQKILYALDKNQWSKALVLSDNLDDPILTTYVNWVKLRKGFGSFEDYVAFLRKYDHWPGLKLLRQQGEAKIKIITEPSLVVRYFENNNPYTGFGSMKLIEAFEELNLKDNVSKEINRAWLNLALERQEFNFFKKKYRNKTILIASERIDFLLWNGMTSQAKRVINYLDKDIRTLAKARISLRSQSYGVDSLISKVPANLKEDPGLAYERFIWRARKGRIDSATEILKTHSQSKEMLKFPLKWSRKRRDYARQAMRDNKSELAYYLASNHFVSGGSDYADLEWLAGYISLTKLKNPSRAIMHFNNFLNEVATPISLGRAGYWLGRSYEEENNLLLSNYYYSLSSNYQSSFYGQLSSEKIDKKLRREFLLPYYEKNVGETDFQKSDIFRLAVLFQNVNEQELSRRFFSHFAESLNESEHLQLTNFLANLKNDYLALVLSKQAARKGHIYPNTYFPVHKMASLSLKVAPEIALAVARRESEFNSNAVSRAGARGLMQLMPSTAKKVADELNLKYSLKRLNTDWKYNVELGSEYMHFLLGKYDGSLLLALGAYNAGPSRMDGWIKKYGDPRQKGIDYVDWIEHIPFNETRNYIMRVMEAFLIYRIKLNYKSPQPIKIELSLKK